MLARLVREVKVDVDDMDRQRRNVTRDSLVFRELVLEAWFTFVIGMPLNT